MCLVERGKRSAGRQVSRGACGWEGARLPAPLLRAHGAQRGQPGGALRCAAQAAPPPATQMAAPLPLPLPPPEPRLPPALACGNTASSATSSSSSCTSSFCSFRKLPRHARLRPSARSCRLSISLIDCQHERG